MIPVSRSASARSAPRSPNALITGGAIGIGRATGLAFGKAGYHVIVTDILDKEGSEAADAIAAAGGEASFRRLDVRDTQGAPSRGRRS